MENEKYIKLLKELNEARLEVIKEQDVMIKALREMIDIKDVLMKLKRFDPS